MIILFEENETLFTSLGLGVLKDVLTASVSEKRNESLEFTMTYPVTGEHYEDIKIGRIVYCKANPFDEAQPFRIYSITRPINGIVTVDAFHISYDMNGIPVKALDGQNLNEVLEEIQNEKFDEEGKRINYTLIDNKFRFITDVTNTRTYKTTAPYNMRAILMGGDDSLLTKYEAEIKFDKYDVYILMRRGADRGAKVVYGHNMTDLNHKTNDETLYNGVFPYYHSEKTTTDTTSEDSFKKVYIVGSKPFQDGWLSYTKDGQPYHPVDEAPVQIDSEGEYYQKVYTWDPIYQQYIERIYNEQVTLIQGVIEPTWISIDWSKFPAITCRAAKAGYFKTIKDTTWSELKGVGDAIFEGSIINSGIIENMIIYYSEVIPTSGNKENVERTEIIDVQLDDPIIWLETPDAKSLKFNKILTLDLTNEFNEEPSKERLQAKAEEYIIKNKIGQLKHSTTVSFIDLSRTTERDMYQNFDHIELGDTVRVVYEDSGVDVELRVIATTYDPIIDQYTKLDLGEVEKKMSTSSVQTGDNVSALTNDLGFATTTQVQKIIAETITADYIQAINAQFSEAQIKQLEVERINCAGIMEASQFNLDKLVAKLLIAEDAEIKNTLTAGNIKVVGDVSILSGNIDIHDSEGTKYFSVDREGNLIANSVTINGGSLDINGIFRVDTDGTMFASNARVEGEIYATAGEIGGCRIENGILKVQQANIEGEITANSLKVGPENRYLFYANADTSEVEIAGFDVYDGSMKAGEIESFSDKNHNGVYLGTDGIRLGPNFAVDPSGIITAYDVNITGGTLHFGGSEYDPNFSVDEDGVVTCKDINITGGSMHFGGYDPSEPAFEVDSDGTAKANNLLLTGGEIKGDGNLTIDFPNFKVNSLGEIEGLSALLGPQYSNYAFNKSCIREYDSSATRTINATGSGPWFVDGRVLKAGAYVFYKKPSSIRFIDDINVTIEYAAKSYPSGGTGGTPKLVIILRMNQSNGEMIPGSVSSISSFSGCVGYIQPSTSSVLMWKPTALSDNKTGAQSLTEYITNDNRNMKYYTSGYKMSNGIVRSDYNHLDNEGNITYQQIFEINTSNPSDPYIYLCDNVQANDHYIRLNKNDIEIKDYVDDRVIYVKEKIKELETKSNKVTTWGSVGYFNQQSPSTTPEVIFIGCPLKNIYAITSSLYEPNGMANTYISRISVKSYYVDSNGNLHVTFNLNINASVSTVMPYGIFIMAYGSN